MTARGRLQALSGAALALFALPALISELRVAPARAILERAAAGAVLSAGETALLARTPGSSETALSARGLAGDLNALKRLAAAAPRDPYVWARLAHAELRAGFAQDAAMSLSRSWKTGPWERLILLSRLTLSARLWPYLRPSVRARVLAALRQAHALYRADLLKTLPPSHVWPLYRAAFLDRPRVLAALASAD